MKYIIPLAIIVATVFAVANTENNTVSVLLCFPMIGAAWYLLKQIIEMLINKNK